MPVADVQLSTRPLTSLPRLPTITSLTLSHTATVTQFSTTRRINPHFCIPLNPQFPQSGHTLSAPLNHVPTQLYRTGSDCISEHSDKKIDVVRGSFIVNRPRSSVRYDIEEE
jgi:hypothetical protein